MANQEPPPLFDAGELKKWSFYRALIAEFIATLLFLYITVSTVIGYKSQIGPNKNGHGCRGIGILGIAWAFGGMIFVLLYCIDGISDGHINPAVTFGCLLARKVSLISAVLYMVAQSLGAIAGVALVKYIQNGNFEVYGGGANELSDGYSTGTGLAAEIIGTFIIVYTALSATDPKRNAENPHFKAELRASVFEAIEEEDRVVEKEEVLSPALLAYLVVAMIMPNNCMHLLQVLAPLSIGFAVFMVHLATIPITGTGINPARSLGAAVIYNKNKTWDEHWIFWVGPFIGAAAAAFYHQIIMRTGVAKDLGVSRSEHHV